jgi:hypothetical protein
MMLQMKNMMTKLKQNQSNSSFLVLERCVFDGEKVQMWKRDGTGGRAVAAAAATAATNSFSCRGAGSDLWAHAISTNVTTANTTAG